MTRADLDMLALSTARMVKAAIVESQAPLLARIAALEARPVGLRHVGVWDASKAYAVHDGVTRDGSTWICKLANTGLTPGSGPEWVLCCKRGRDGKDAR